MKNYENYEIEDFLRDDFFVEWILAPEKEHVEFWNNWVKAYPQCSDKVLRAKQILKSIKKVPVNATISESEISSIVTSIYNKKQVYRVPVIRKPGLLSGNQTWYRVAAILLIVIGVGYFVRIQHNGKSSAITKISSENRVVSTLDDSIKISNNTLRSRVIKMEDGSIVVLSPNSELSYPKHFNPTSREVVLNGEAFFEICHNDLKSFLIYSNGIITKDLGTSFTVRAFKVENEYKIIVQTGKVQVYKEEASNNKTIQVIQPIIALPNQQITFVKSQSIFKESNIDDPLPLSQEVANKSFSFTNTPFNDVIAQLENAYHISVDYDKEKFEKYTITASLSKLPLDEKIKMICKVINAECTFVNGTINIK
jgi:hypothetical protein